MSETLIPTMSLRFVERPIYEEYAEIVGPVPGFESVGMVQMRPAKEQVGSHMVLQQRFTTTGGRDLWRDVPVGEE